MATKKPAKHHTARIISLPNCASIERRERIRRLSDRVTKANLWIAIQHVCGVWRTKCAPWKEDGAGTSCGKESDYACKACLKQTKYAQSLGGSKLMIVLEADDAQRQIEQEHDYEDKVQTVPLYDAQASSPTIRPLVAYQRLEVKTVQPSSSRLATKQ